VGVNSLIPTVYFAWGLAPVPTWLVPEAAEFRTTRKPI
jgi:hypothetical protein